MDASTSHDTTRVESVLQKIERTRQARRHKFYLRDEKITLSHGSGGKASTNLVEGVFAPAFSNPILDGMNDAATFDIDGSSTRVAFTTDTYVVSPLFFPGGNIGQLAVHGTLNDLAMAGAKPLYLSAGFILEEGFPIADLRRIVSSMADAASAAGVSIVTGDTKVVQRGKADGLFINTAGVGTVSTPAVLMNRPSALPRCTTLVSPVTIETPAAEAASAIDETMRRRSAMGNPSSRIKPAER